MQGTLVSRLGEFTQVYPSDWQLKMYENHDGELGANISYNQGFFVDLGWWSGGVGYESRPFTINGEQCYLAIAHAHSDVNDGTPTANQSRELVEAYKFEFYVNNQRIGIHGTSPVDRVVWGQPVYNIKGNRTFLTAFWSDETITVDLEGRFTALWPKSIGHAGFSFQDIYAIPVGIGFCNAVNFLD
jgi:hypothetical protein